MMKYIPTHSPHATPKSSKSWTEAPLSSLTAFATSHSKHAPRLSERSKRKNSKLGERKPGAKKCSQGKQLDSAANSSKEQARATRSTYDWHPSQPLPRPPRPTPNPILPAHTPPCKWISWSHPSTFPTTTSATMQHYQLYLPWSLEPAPPHPP
ncbi:hypothetical protein HaLaN_04031 [Haematococcus lacustris]|uniref:Uncharacterized protein n=1 Tax=Haematococcus lacustris TaxID=44745 RepID=A0A699YM90_HAELA|nr:hypothetical protein HaLaN_04031 [Haematococcus lacustris]